MTGDAIRPTAPIAVALGVIALVAGAVATHAASARPAAATAAAAELDRVERYGIPLVAYATVRRDDGTYRRMLIDPDILAGLAPGADLPDGTRILMETYYSPQRVSTVFHKLKSGGAWEYGSFAAARPDLDTRPQASCLSCHARAGGTDFTFTAPSIWAAAEGRGASDFGCSRGGRSPCGPATYRDGAAR